MKKSTRALLITVFTATTLFSGVTQAEGRGNNGIREEAIADRIIAGMTIAGTTTAVAVMKTGMITVAIVTLNPVTVSPGRAMISAVGTGAAPFPR